MRSFATGPEDLSVMPLLPRVSIHDESASVNEDVEIIVTSVVRHRTTTKARGAERGGEEDVDASAFVRERCTRETFDANFRNMLSVKNNEVLCRES